MITVEPEDIDALKNAVSECEVHASYEGREKELEIREKRVTWSKPTANTFTIQSAGVDHVFYYDRIEHWYQPDSLEH